ncbi:hypothetical protein BN946_scf184791.g20 [Trametes cinnabarina]|uniref:Uncharacterized protein n=1 Tax=Pycnoporus cinnabarinus TaxID=5643 RepID=A0A060S514_PYCCI|nr:hypothetical protein BN946_scf184791.g20 [Trametes cinnabarina]
MGFFTYTLLAFVLFVFLRQLPSHKLHVLVRNLQEAQTFFASQVEQGIFTGQYAEDYRKRLNELQAQTDALRKIMQRVWPFSPHDFYYMFQGVTKQCYKLTDDVESLRNDMGRTSSYERMRSSYKPMPYLAQPAQLDGYATDTSMSTMSSAAPSAATSPTRSPVSSPSSPPPFSVANSSILPTHYDRRFTTPVKTTHAF